MLFYNSWGCAERIATMPCRAMPCRASLQLSLVHSMPLTPLDTLNPGRPRLPPRGAAASPPGAPRVWRSGFCTVYLDPRTESLHALQALPCNACSQPARVSRYRSAEPTAVWGGHAAAPCLSDAGDRGAKSAVLGSACACVEAHPTSCGQEQSGETPAPPRTRQAR